MRWLKVRAENVAVILIAVMFLSFMVQIVSRYVFRDPVSWTMELCLTVWLWLVFWGGAFLLGHRDHIRFDVFYNHVHASTRRVFALVSAVAVVVAFAISFLPTLDYITFMKIERSATLRIRLDLVFSVYMIFLVAVLLRYTAIALGLIRGRMPDELETLPPDVGQP